MRKYFEEAVNLLGDINKTEKAFLKVMTGKFKDENKEKTDFYCLLYSLLTKFQQSDRAIQLIVQYQNIALHLHIDKATINCVRIIR